MEDNKIEVLDINLFHLSSACILWEDPYVRMSCLNRMCRNDRQHPILLFHNHSFGRKHLYRYGRLMLPSRWKLWLVWLLVEGILSIS